jgi:hypothetical protein
MGGETMRFIVLFLFFIIPFQVFGQFEQYLQEDPEPHSEKQWGGAFSVIESGSGLGLFYALPLKNFYHVGATFNVFLLRDSKQFEYYYYTFNKKNNVYLFDLQITLKKRLFAHQIDDQFRPFIAIGAGPVYGMNFPEQETNPDGTKNEKQFRLTLAGAVAAGVDAVVDADYLFGIRLQYRIMKFPGMLGERQDHSMFDVRLEFGKLF